MLSRDELAELYRELQGRKVLSVYADGVGHDPAMRRAWRRRLEQELEREEERVARTDPSELGAFRAAREHVAKEVDRFPSFLPGKGFVAFSTAEGLQHAEVLPVQVPILVRWEDGPRVAAYIRGLKQLRPMVTALVDSRRARVFLYREGKLEEVEDLRADTFLGDLADTAASKRAMPHTGSRGETGTDAAQRALDAGRERMLRMAKERVLELAGPDGFVLLGGSQEALAALRSLMPKGIEERVLENPSLFVEMSAAEVKAATAEGASVLSKRRQTALLNQVLEQARGRGNGCLGGKDTVKALREGRVDILLLSKSFVEANPDFADECVGDAFRQNAEVRVLSGEPGERLDAEGGGIGARLRYRLEEPREADAEAEVA